MAKPRKGQPEVVVTDGSVLAPVKKDLGPTLSVEDGKVRIAFGIRNALWPIGRGQDEAATITTYTTIIPEGEASGFSNLTKEGYLLTGWMLLDGNGQVLGRLANDDETVYEMDDVRRFAKFAGLKVDDWGRVDHAKIDELMKTPRTARDDKGLPLAGATGREWIMALMMLGGMLIAWPFASRLEFASTRGHGVTIMIIGISGFIVGAIGLFIARAMVKLPDKLVLAIGLVGAAVGLIGGLLAAANGVTFWRLVPAQVATVFAGLGLIFAGMPFWARLQRD